MTNQFSASAPALGYVYQIRFALWQLLRAVRDTPDAELAIERLDDVSFERDGTAIELIQLKFHMLREATLTDSSTDLWKTLRIWSARLSQEASGFDTLILTLVTTGQVPNGGAPALLKLNKERDETAALEKLRKVAQSSHNRENEKAYSAFMNLPLDKQQLLLSRIRIVDRGPDFDELEQKLNNELRVNTPHYEALRSRLEGWWFERAVDNLINSSQLNTIDGTELIAKVRELTAQFQEDNLPNDFPGLEEMEEAVLTERERAFVEQLKLVLVSNSRLRLAIGSYYKAFQQRTRWLQEGLIYPRELSDYEKYLEGEWRMQFTIMKEDLGALPTEDELRALGKRLLNWADTSQPMPIRPKFMDASFSRGNFHILANDMRIGWHPEFAERLAHLMAEAAQKVP